MKTSTARFSDRVEDYVKYRPHYPQQIIELLKNKIELNISSVIADIGSGTGISTGLFLNKGNKVFTVEPNNKMREAAELIYLKESNFISVNGTAENTNLEEHSIDIIICAQAFHWFNISETKNEFKRILKPTGHIVLIWNVRKEKDDFQNCYEMILKSIPEYNDVKHRNISDKEIINFFAPKPMQKESVANFQTLNLNGLKGRLKSSSYCPTEGDEYERLMHELDILFYKFEKDGIIKFEYETKVYYC
jgi:ubiquinone/menaquinone biosynthesis C-methylase UbiE